MKHRWTAGLVAATLGVGLFTVGAPGAHASSKGRKNTALVLGGVAAYHLLKGKTTKGLVAGAGAAYAYKRYRDKRKEEQRRASYSGTSYRGSGLVDYQRSADPTRVNCRPPRTRDDYIDEATGLRSIDVPAPGTVRPRRDYGAEARAEAYRNSIYGRAEAAQDCPPGGAHRR